VVTESRLRVDGMVAAQRSRSRWVLPEIFTAGWEVWARIEKIRATENAVSLGQAEGIYLTREGENPDTAQTILHQKCHDWGSHGRGFHPATQ